MSDSEGDPSPRSSPSSSCSLSTLLETFSGRRTIPMGRRSVFAKSGSATKRDYNGCTVRKPSLADRRHATEVIEISSDEESNMDGIEFLEEVVDGTGDGDSECEILRHSDMENNGELVSDTDDGVEGTSCPTSNPSGSEGGNSFVDIGSGSVSPFTVGSPLSSFHSTSSYEVFGSSEADLLVSDYSSDGCIFELSDSEEMTVEISSVGTDHGERDETFPGGAAVFSVEIHDDKGSVPWVQGVPAGQGNQKVSVDHEAQDGLNTDARQNGGVLKNGEQLVQSDLDSGETESNGGKVEGFSGTVRAVPHVVVIGPNELDRPVGDQ